MKSARLAAASKAQSLLHGAYESLIPAGNWPGRVLLIQLGQIGDFALTMPLITALKDRYRGIYLGVLTDSINFGLASNCQQIDKTFYYNSRKYSRSSFDASFPEKQLSNEGFENIIWLRGDLKSFLWMAKRKLPMRSLARIPNPLRTAWLPLLTGKKNKKSYSHFLQALGTIDPEIRPDLTALRAGEKDISKAGKVFIHIGSGGTLRRWPEENFSAVCRMLLNEYPPIEINLLGSERDFVSGERILGLIKDSKRRAFNRCGQIPLEGLSSTLKNGVLYIGFDSGPMHIAALAGIPVVALMGPQSPDVFGPWCGKNKRVVYKDYYCSPCWQFSCLHVESGPGKCVIDIRPEDVFTEAQSLLKAVGTGYEKDTASL